MYFLKQETTPFTEQETTPFAAAAAAHLAELHAPPGKNKNRAPAAQRVALGRYCALRASRAPLESLKRAFREP